MDFWTVIILIGVGAVAGYVLGLIDSRATAAVKKILSKDPAPEAEKQPQEQNLPGEHTALKATVDAAFKWHLELDGTRIADQTAISPEQRQRLVNVIVQLRPWIDGKPAPATPVAVPQPARPAAVPLNPAVTPEQRFQVAETPPKVDALRGFRSMLKNEIKTPEQNKSKSIVAMIDEVLQAKLLGSPLLAKGIRLEEGPLGEVLVFVGSNRYTGVDTVPDPEIQAFIRSAIADWEKK